VIVRPSYRPPLSASNFLKAGTGINGLRKHRSNQDTAEAGRCPELARFHCSTELPGWKKEHGGELWIRQRDSS